MTRTIDCETAGGFKAYPTNIRTSHEPRASAVCTKNEMACPESFELLFSSSVYIVVCIQPAPEIFSIFLAVIQFLKYTLRPQRTIPD
jgi:hypothetical protein